MSIAPGKVKVAEMKIGFRLLSETREFAALAVDEICESNFYVKGREPVTFPDYPTNLERIRIICNLALLITCRQL
jgi:hypothetical protein